MNDAANVAWSDLSERYSYATIYLPGTRRHWWQIWRKRERILWSGPIEGQP